MSVLTTTPLHAAPSAAVGVTVTTGVMPAWGAWVEVLAATAAPLAVAGVQLAAGSYSATDGELDIGVGAASAEASVGTLRLYLQNSGGLGTPVGSLLPVPLGGIGAGVRVAVRARAVGGGTSLGTVGLLYYENLSSDQVTTSSQVLTSAPSGSASPTITPNASAWANSAWVELVASAATGLGLLGLVHGITTGAEDGIEYDFGTGGSGSETVITTLREAPAVGRLPYTWLPGLYPVAAGTRVSVRMRKAGTSTTAHPVALLYYTNVSAVSAAVERVQSYVWMPV